MRAPILSLTFFFASALAASAGCSSSNGGSSKTTGPGGSSAGPVTGGGASATRAVSGTRLRAKSITGGGARDVVSFHDMDRNEDCTFQHAEDGRTRCLPATTTASQNGTFSDPGCQVPSLIAPAPTCAGDFSYAIVENFENCSTVTAEIRKLVDPATPRYVRGPSGCSVAATPPVVPGRAGAVPVGDVIPWTAFVEAVETVVPGDPVSEKILMATDGALQHLSYRDTKLDVDCSYQLMSDGVTRCVPEARQGQVMYGDDACTKPLAVNDFSSTGCGATTTATTADDLWLEPAQDECGGVRNVYRLGTFDANAVGSAVFQIPSGNQGNGAMGNAETCVESGTLRADGPNFRTVANNLNATLASTPRVSNGADRLVAAFVWPPGEKGLVAGWHDTMSDVDCTFTLATDGKMRCLPLASSATILHTDDACKSPGIVAVLSEASCIGLRRYARVVSSTCPSTTRIFALGADARDLTGASVDAGPGQCGKVSQAMSAFDATEIDPSQFVEGVSAVE